MSSDRIFVRDISIGPCVKFQRSAYMSNYLPSGSDMQNIMARERLMRHNSPIRVMRRNSPIIFDRATDDHHIKTENDGQEANKQPANEFDIDKLEVNDTKN